MGISAIGIGTAVAWWAAMGAVQYVDLDAGWTHTTKGPWQSRVDHRGLLAMHHPWVPVTEGNFAMATRTVAIPDGMTEPIALAFYCSDDYHTAPGDPAMAALAAEGFVGHRRRQVLVDDRLVWSEDVSDPVRPGESPYFRVPVTVPEGARALRISLVAYDTLGTAERTVDDFYRPSKPGLTPETDPDAGRFRTTVFWGDLALVSGGTTLAARPRPSERRVLERHNRTWPPTPDTARWREKTFPLSVSAPGGIPEAGFPLVMGIPMPEGVVMAPQEFRLRDATGARYVQKAAGATWPDGSLRWVRVRTPVAAGTKSLDLSFRGDSTKAPGAIRQSGEEGGPLTLDTGTLALAVGPGDPVSAIRWKGKTVVETVRLGLEIAGEVTPGTGDQWRIVEEGPFYTEAVVEGRFEGLNRSNGSFDLHVGVFAGLPYVKLWFRFFNDTQANLDLSHLRMDFVLPEAPAGVTLPHGPVEGDFQLTQADFARYEIGEATHEAAQPGFVQWDGGALVVKHFRELFPKAVARVGNELTLDLIAGGNRPVTLTPGEAKSHEIWLGLGKQDGAALAAVVEQPPILQNPAYWCATGALGPAAPLPEDSPYAAYLAEAYGGKSWAQLGQSLGLRHFPDGPYLGNAGAWANDYNGRMMGLWNLWAMTGDRAWFDRASAVSAHLLDVAIVHTEVPGRDWLGAMHGPGPNHVSGPWNPTLNAEGLLLYAHLTGNPAARAAFLGVSDYCVRTEAGMRGANARHVAAPFATICATYRETGEITFLEAGAERLTAMLARVDRRRGVWFDWHGSEVYPGNVPWMAAQLAGPLYTWYQLTGDVEAAQLLVGLAESLICENTPWEAPGAMRTYSPNPRYPSAIALDPFIIPLLYAAYELSEDTFFRDAARAQWERWHAAPAFQDAFNLSWHWPWLNACVERGLAAEPR